MKITDNIKYVGVNDYSIDLFEGQYHVPNGMSYNSYVILDEKIAVVDTVDVNYKEEWLANIAGVLDGKKPDYLIIHHMEPDHSANIVEFMNAYPDVIIVSNKKAFEMMDHFFDYDFEGRTMEVIDGGTLSLGKHTLAFVFAPMVHWPEAMLSYETSEKILFSADAFGKFGALDAEDNWKDEARRYFIGIVGKYGTPVQILLKKAAALDIQMICPLHGPVLKENLGYYINLYDTWSSYRVEEEGVIIAYTSIYGNTRKAAHLLRDELVERGANVVLYDLARDDMAQVVADAFRFSKLVVASPTYNGTVFPFMMHFLLHLEERNYQNRTVGIIENGSWACTSGKVIKQRLGSLKNIHWLDSQVTILSSVKDQNIAQIKAMADELMQ